MSEPLSDAPAICSMRVWSEDPAMKLIPSARYLYFIHGITHFAHVTAHITCNASGFVHRAVDCQYRAGVIIISDSAVARGSVPHLAQQQTSQEQQHFRHLSADAPAVCLCHPVPLLPPTAGPVPDSMSEISSLRRPSKKNAVVSIQKQIEYMGKDSGYNPHHGDDDDC